MYIRRYVHSSYNMYMLNLVNCYLTNFYWEMIVAHSFEDSLTFFKVPYLIFESYISNLYVRKLPCTGYGKGWGWWISVENVNSSASIRGFPDTYMEIWWECEKFKQEGIRLAYLKNWIYKFFSKGRGNAMSWSNRSKIKQYGDWQDAIL